MLDELACIVEPLQMAFSHFSVLDFSSILSPDLQFPWWTAPYVEPEGNPCGLPAGSGWSDGRADAAVHRQRWERGHRHALRTEPVLASDLRWVYFHWQHGTLRSLQEALYLETESGKSGECLLHIKGTGIRNPKAHVGWCVLHQNRIDWPRRGASLKSGSSCYSEEKRT